MSKTVIVPDAALGAMKTAGIVFTTPEKVELLRQRLAQPGLRRTDVETLAASVGVSHPAGVSKDEIAAALVLAYAEGVAVPLPPIA